MKRPCPACTTLDAYWIGVEFQLLQSQISTRDNLQLVQGHAMSNNSSCANLGNFIYLKLHLCMLYIINANSRWNSMFSSFVLWVDQWVWCTITIDWILMICKMKWLSCSCHFDRLLCFPFCWWNLIRLCCFSQIPEQFHSKPKSP